MNNATPERLQQFREAHASAARVNLRIALFWGISLLAALLAGGLLTRWAASRPSEAAASPRAGMSADQCRQYAAYLEQKALPEAALEAYHTYLNQAQVSDAVRARTCYHMATLAFDNDRYEDALVLFYQAQFLGPEDTIRDEVDRMIVRCLDHLDRTDQVRRELRAQTGSSTPPSGSDSAPVLAAFGDETITTHDLEAYLSALPDPLRQQIEGSEQQMAAVRRLAAERLLAERAYRLGFGDAPEVEQQLARQRDALVVRRMMDALRPSDSTVTAEKVEQFYRAHADQYRQPQQARVRIARAASLEALEADPEYGETVHTVYKGLPLASVDVAPEQLEAVFSTPAGDSVPPVKGESTAWWRFLVVEHLPATPIPLQAVEEEIRLLLAAEAEQAHRQELLEEALSTRDVQYYPERLEGGEGS